MSSRPLLVMPSPLLLATPGRDWTEAPFDAVFASRGFQLLKRAIGVSSTNSIYITSAQVETPPKTFSSRVLPLVPLRAQECAHDSTHRRNREFGSRHPARGANAGCFTS